VFLLSFLPDILALSVTMSFNIEKIKDIIDSIKKNKELEKMKIMVGGRIFNEHPDLWHAMGADGFAVNTEDAKKLALKWEKENAH
jgi:methanogenic corrinoid protein MtbC1